MVWKDRGVEVLLWYISVGTVFALSHWTYPREWIPFHVDQGIGG